MGVEGIREREAYYPKPGLTSLAAVSARGIGVGTTPREEDVRQFDHYYARNHTIGMDCEILLKAMLAHDQHAINS